MTAGIRMPTSVGEFDALRAHVRHRVACHVVEAHLEVEVATGRVTGASDSSDLLANTDLLTVVHHRPAVHDVAVCGGDAAAVFVGDLHEVAVAAERTCVDHGAAVRGEDRRVAAGRQVDTRVVRGAPAAGRDAVSEAAADVTAGGPRPSGGADHAGAEPCTSTPLRLDAGDVLRLRVDAIRLQGGQLRIEPSLVGLLFVVGCGSGIRCGLRGLLGDARVFGQSLERGLRDVRLVGQ